MDTLLRDRHPTDRRSSPLRRGRLALAAAALLAAVAPATAVAAPVWVGDFETNDLSQWNNTLNGTHISVVDTPVIQGAHAAQIQLTNDATWPNGLKRVELHHSPAAGRTAEGAQTYFAWSYFLPVTLPTDPSQQIGYWESDSSYHQIMAFNVAGEHVQFITQKPQYKVAWEADGMAKAGAWHRIAMHILWSQDPATGFVDVWYDGAQVVNHVGAQTLPDSNSAFTQVGLLRGAIEFQDSPIIVLDDAVEGDSLADVHPDLPMGQGGAGGAGSTGASTSNTSAATGATSGATTGGGGTSSTSGAGGGVGIGTDTNSGCGCAFASRNDEAASVAFAALVFAVARGRRRRAQP